MRDADFTDLAEMVSRIEEPKKPWESYLQSGIRK